MYILHIFSGASKAFISKLYVNLLTKSIKEYFPLEKITYICYYIIVLLKKGFDVQMRITFAKLMTFISVLTLLLAFHSLSADAIDPKYETVKVGLSYSSTAKSQVTLSSASGFYGGYMNGSAFVNLYPLGATTLTITPAGVGAVSINGTVSNTVGGNFAVSPVNGVVSIDGKNYRGGVEFIPDSNGRLTVINFVNINDYIAAVVGKEMSPTWNIEALKAQAVCARSYAVTTWNRHSSLGFNLCATQDCQTYLGMSGETESTIRAANETKDQLLMYNGSVVQALYSSSNGGSIGYAKYVWGNDVPYLQAGPDPYEANTGNPRASWSVDLTKADIKKKLANASVNIGEITDFKVTGADEYGRTYEVTIYGTNGTHVLKNDKTRSFFGLYSQRYSITPKGSSSQPPVVKVMGSDSSADLTWFIAMGSKVSLGLGSDYYSISSSGKQLHTGSVANANSWVINGSGWGHGLGLSQYGAKGMADQGFTYDQILTFYYKGAYLQ